MVVPIALLQSHETGDGLARNLVWFADHRGLRHRRVAHQGALDFHGAETMPADIHHIIDASQDPEVAVLVSPGGVSSHVDSFKAFPVLLLVPLWLAPQRARHARPGTADNEEAFPVSGHRVSLQIHHICYHSGQGEGSRTGL